MRAVHNIMLCLCLLSSCSLFKTNTKQERKLTIATETELEERENLQFGKEIGILSFSYSTDSANHAYQFEIIPKGLFSFSLDSGFRGEALSLKVQGNFWKQKQQSELEEQIERVAMVADKQAEYRHQDAMQAEQIEKKQSFKTSWLLLGGLLVLSIACFLYWKPR